MQTLVIKIVIKLAYFKKKSWNIHYKTGKDKRNVSQNKIKQIKSQKTSSAKPHSNHSWNDSRNWWPNSWNLKIKKRNIASMERKDPSNWERAAAEENRIIEEAIDSQRKRKGVEAKRDQNKVIEEIDTASYLRICSQETASKWIARYEGIPTQEEYKTPLKVINIIYYLILL